jgi:diaminohydroxyphosphoribosylaminopyrimidine deaminase / 5-amino-6-(5-phosphoribosylamino)uracil reductase
MGAPKTPEQFMRRAVQLSKRGFPAPNPHVGCVIVNGNEIVGEGFHAYAGGPHAEVVALAQAGDRAKGATVYCTLEPCNHHGRTGPCSQALIAAGVQRVVVASPDPNPKASGGAETLRSHQIDVEIGLLQSEAEAANKVFLFAMRHRRPYVVAKAATSLDGRIALPSGESQWITGERARREGRKLRAGLGAVLVGAGTVLADNPQLTARVPGVVNEPVRIVLDSCGALTGGEALFKASGRAIHVIPTGSTSKSPAAIEMPLRSGGFDLPALLTALAGKGIIGVLVEGGSRTLSSFFGAGLVDQLELFMAPKLLSAGRVWLEGEAPPRLADAPELTLARVRRLGADLQLTYLKNPDA